MVKRIEETKSLIRNKAHEYARGDRLSNFKWVAKMDDVSPATALWGMWVKHICSIKYLVADTEIGLYPSLDLIKEKCGDMVVYAILLEAIFMEELDKQYGNNVNDH